MRILLSRALLITILVNGLVLSSTMQFNTVQASAEAPGVIVIISSDTTWTKADSPHTLTGPLLVQEGVTLTIEAGATVNLNYYEMRVEGTLVVIGSSEQIHFNNGIINVTETSNGWNEQTGSGFLIKHAVLDDVDLFSSVSLKLVDSTASIPCEINVGGSSIIRGNTLWRLSITGGLAVVSNNDIGSIEDCYGSPEILYNTIGAISFGSGGSPIISYNTIQRIGSYDCYYSTDSPVVMNNIIKGELCLSASSATISNNTFLGYVHGEDLTGRHFSHQLGFSPIIAFSAKSGGSSVISHNTITGCTYSYSYEHRRYLWPTTENDTVTTSGISIEGYDDDIYVINNTIADCNSGISGGTIIEGNRLINNRYGISVDDGNDNVVIRNNNITTGAGEIGIGVYDTVGTVAIENNFVSGYSGGYSGYGMSISYRQATICNNTIKHSRVAIQLNSCPSASINYNSIENYSENSIYLGASSGNVDATNNWWGTTDTQAINLTIHDSKYSFDLGTVTFVPFLTEPNPEAMPSENLVIPEFPSWIILQFFLTSTLVVVIYRKRLASNKAD